MTLSCLRNTHWPRWIRRITLIVAVSTILGCGGGSSAPSGIRSVITEAEFSLVSPPSPSQLFAVLRFLTRLSNAILSDPDGLSRALFDGVRDSVANGTPVPGNNLDELFRLGVDQLTSDAWRLILTDPISGIVAGEVFENALQAALSNFSCAAHNTHLGAKTEAFFQAFWIFLISQLTSSTFGLEFANKQSETRAAPAQAIFRSNAQFGVRVLQEFTAVTPDQAIELLASSPFVLSAAGGAISDALAFADNALALDGRYQGTAEQRLSSSTANVVLQLNRCNDTVWGQLRVLDSAGNTDAEWRLRGTVAGDGRISLSSISALERFFDSTKTLLCRDLTVELTELDGRLSGDWRSSALTCPLGGSLTANRSTT